MVNERSGILAEPFPCEPMDLTLAKRVLGELAKQDGDLGAAYWNSVLNLLAQAGRMHAELLTIQAKRLRR